MSIERIVELNVEVELTEECEWTERPPPVPETTLLPEMAYGKKTSTLEAKSSQTRIPVISNEQCARKANILTKFTLIVENIMKIKEGKGQHPPNGNGKKGGKKGQNGNSGKAGANHFPKGRRR